MTTTFQKKLHALSVCEIILWLINTLSLRLKTHKTHHNKVRNKWTHVFQQIGQKEFYWSNGSTTCLLFIISVFCWDFWLIQLISLNPLPGVSKQLVHKRHENWLLVNPKTHTEVKYHIYSPFYYDWKCRSPQSPSWSSSSSCSSLWSPLSLGLDKQLEQRRLWAEELAIVDGQIQGLEMELRQQARWVDFPIQRIFYFWFFYLSTD